MPSILPRSKVLVTGANGFLALWIVKTLLEQDYSVRAAVRKGHGEHLKASPFNSYANCGKLGIVYLQDITKEGAFDEAVIGVDGILHTACPGDFSAGVSASIEPTITSMISLVKSAEKANVKRIVFTSSSAAISLQGYACREFDEGDWNEAALAEVSRNSRVVSSRYKYAAAKTAAEKAAFDYYEKNKESLTWDVVSLLPAGIYGPILQKLDSPSKMCHSMLEWFNTMFENRAPYLPGHIWVDVRDAALAHVLALEKKEAGGERILLSSGSFLWKEWMNCANSISPPIYNFWFSNDHLAPPPPCSTLPYKFNNAKSLRILGMKYRGMAETTEAILEQFDKLCW